MAGKAGISEEVTRLMNQLKVSPLLRLQWVGLDELGSSGFHASPLDTCS
jgi:hypothetical protein